ncbi:hypothetical protein [Aquimarina longa]|uniref:hypothetical protein n=1 Tax=Aquimarina longa TaxID=1080221 RepID=UPI000785950C|nr:hypothetical protein [Aquimarina longa]
MRKTKNLFVILFILSGFIAQANVYIRYYNKDSKNHTFEVKIAGSSKTVDFDSSRTSSVTIQGGSEKAEIKTDCGWITITNNSKIEIKDGCITIK